MAINPMQEGVWNPPVPVDPPEQSFFSLLEQDKRAGSVVIIAFAAIVIAAGVGTLGVIPIIVGAVVAGMVVAYWGYRLGCWIHDRFPVGPPVGEPDHAPEHKLSWGLPPPERSEGH